MWKGKDGITFRGALTPPEITMYSKEPQIAIQKVDNRGR